MLHQCVVLSHLYTFFLFHIERISVDHQSSMQQVDQLQSFEPSLYELLVPCCLFHWPKHSHNQTDESVSQGETSDWDPYPQAQVHVQRSVQPLRTDGLSVGRTYQARCYLAPLLRRCLGRDAFPWQKL